MKNYSDKLNGHKPRAPRRDALTQLTRCYNNYTAYRDSVDGNLHAAAALHLATVRACLPDARRLLAAIEAECGESESKVAEIGRAFADEVPMRADLLSELGRAA